MNITEVILGNSSISWIMSIKLEFLQDQNITCEHGMIPLHGLLKKWKRKVIDMKYPMRTKIRTKNGNKAVIVGVLPVISETAVVTDGEYYIGYIITGDGQLLSNIWSINGQSLERIVGYDLSPITNEFGIGNWRIVSNNDSYATVTTISPHESSRYRLIGFVRDRMGRMIPERWTLDGIAGSSTNNLDALADHSTMPF